MPHLSEYLFTRDTGGGRVWCQVIWSQFLSRSLGPVISPPPHSCRPPPRPHRCTRPLLAVSVPDQHPSGAEPRHSRSYAGEPAVVTPLSYPQFGQIQIIIQSENGGGDSAGPVGAGGDLAADAALR